LEHSNRRGQCFGGGGYDWRAYTNWGTANFYICTQIIRRKRNAQSNHIRKYLQHTLEDLNSTCELTNSNTSPEETKNNQQPNVTAVFRRSLF
jgi:hypothetical protein